MSEGFVPKGDKLHMMQPQRPGTFVAVTETGRIIEVVVLMDTKKVMTREWEPSHGTRQRCQRRTSACRAK